MGIEMLNMPHHQRLLRMKIVNDFGHYHIQTIGHYQHHTTDRCKNLWKSVRVKRNMEYGFLINVISKKVIANNPKAKSVVVFILFRSLKLSSFAISE